MCPRILAPEETFRLQRLVAITANRTEGEAMKARNVSHLIAAGLAAAAIAAPAASAGAADRVQVNGQLVEPSQVSRAQLEAGHPASSRLVSIGGALVAPSDVSAWQSRADDNGGSAVAASSSGYDSGAVEITAAVIAGALALVGGSMALVRRRRSLAPA
jgi:hypothetical protein